MKQTPDPTPQMPKLPATQTTITQTTETLHESGTHSLKRHGEAGLITDSQHRGD